MGLGGCDTCCTSLDTGGEGAGGLGAFLDTAMDIADDSWNSLQGAMGAVPGSTSVPPVEESTANEVIDPEIDQSTDDLFASVGGVDTSED